jgi:hypothetical protein
MCFHFPDCEGEWRYPHLVAMDAVIAEGGVFVNYK